MPGVYDEQAELRRAEAMRDDPDSTQDMRDAAGDLLHQVRDFKSQHGSKPPLQRMKHWIPVGDAIAAFAARYPADS